MSYAVLLERYKSTEKELKEAEKTLRRISGHQELVSGAGSSKFRQVGAPGRYTGRKRPLYIRRKLSIDEDDDESGADEDEFSPKKPTLQSTVVDKSRVGRSRKATIEVQNATSNIKARNKRMFGALVVGTLEKFKNEEKERRHKEAMRAEIEQKVEAATEEERQKIKKEKERLFITRREKQAQLRCLEKKLERAESFEVFERNHHKMQNFMKTKTKPELFFCPARHTLETKKHLQETKIKIKDTVETRKDIVETELRDIEVWYTKDTLPANKENKHPQASETQMVTSGCNLSLSSSSSASSDTIVLDKDDTDPNDDEDSSKKTIELPLTDQEFEPIYD